MQWTLHTRKKERGGERKRERGGERDGFHTIVNIKLKSSGVRAGLTTTVCGRVSELFCGRRKAPNSSGPRLAQQ